MGFGAGGAEQSADIMPELKRFFQPELLNRIDERIVFRHLAPEDIRRILELVLGEIAERLRVQHGVSLEIDDEVKEFLVQKGYSPEFGARELGRTVEQLLELRLAEKLIACTTAKPMTWRVSLEDGVIEISS